MTHTERHVKLHRFLAKEGQWVPEDSDVVVEDFLSIWIEGAGRYVMVCTPNDTLALAVGFAFSEGLVQGTEDILHLGHHAGDASIVEMKIKNPETDTPGRNLLMTSSCGLCGTRNLEKYLIGEISCDQTLHVSSDLLLEIAREMRTRQEIFTKTGGTHAAALFKNNEIAAFAEDIGRHCAMDKAIGKCLQSGDSPKGCAAMLSGRVSFELVAKAARAGIEMIAAVSSPSSLAIEVAEACGITLCGFVREDRLSVYTHPERIMD